MNDSETGPRFIDARGITIECTIPPDLKVKGDAKALDHVLVNLVQNAVKYGADEGEVIVSAAPKGKRIRIEVRDNGPGISEEHHKRLFERFYRVDKGRSKHMGGTGLGLAIVKHLVLNMGGKVGVAANEPKGACFYVDLPPETHAKS